MPTSFHEKNYISEQKKIYFFLSLISLIMIIILFITYKVFFQKIVILLVAAALCSIPFAQFAIRLSLFFPYTDCKYEIYEKLLTLSPDYYVINNAYFTNSISNCFIDNIVIAEKTILCIIDSKKKNKSNPAEFIKSLLLKKGIEYNFVSIDINEFKIDEIKNYLVEKPAYAREIFNILKAYLI